MRLPAVTVAFPCLNESETIDMALRSVFRQTHPPESVIIADGGSTDGTLDKIEEWKAKLPIKLITNDQKRQGPGLNLCIQENTTEYLARLDGHSSWNERYLEILVGFLADNPAYAAAGGTVRIDPTASMLQRDIWTVMKHPLGTGAPDYRTAQQTRDVQTIQSPVYRQEALEEVGGFLETVPWAEDDELHQRLKNRQWKLRLLPEAELYYQPRQTSFGFMTQCLNYGKGRGTLGRRKIFPSDRHRKIDRVLNFWTLGLAWNPIGWGLFLFYLMVVFFIT
ncbi:MAG: glycosyltransferase, partial [bacterium]